MDEEGYVFLTGRIKEQINRGGEKIAPVAIDNVLMACPGVESLFCFAAPHKELGEVVAVAMVEKKGHSVTLKQLNKFGLLYGQLAAQWLPFVLVYCDAVPKGPTGKVQRTKLASMLGVPALSAADNPRSYRYKAGEPLVEVLTSAQVQSETSDGKQTLPSKSSFTESLEDVVGLELQHLDTVVVDSFTAVTVSTFLHSHYALEVSAKDCLRLSVTRLYATLCLKSLTAAALCDDVENLLGVELAGDIHAPLPMDSFTAVRLASE